MPTLDSDVNSADDKLPVSFYEKDHGPDKGKPYIKILIPGDQNLVTDQPVSDYYKKRFIRKWLAYQAGLAPDAEVIGTPLKKWNTDEPDAFSAGHMEEMQVLKFQTVEQIAQASDGQLQKIGMGGPGLRERARSYLARKNAVQTSSELEDLKKQVAEMREALTKPAPADVVIHNEKPVEVAAPKRRGPKPGWKKASVNVKHDAPVGATGHE